MERGVEAIAVFGKREEGVREISRDQYVSYTYVCVCAWFSVLVFANILAVTSYENLSKKKVKKKEK